MDLAKELTVIGAWFEGKKFFPRKVSAGAVDAHGALVEAREKEMYKINPRGAENVLNQKAAHAEEEIRAMAVEFKEMIEFLITAKGE